MQRRTFLSLLALAPISLAMSCGNRNRMTIEATILETQDQLFQRYNDGLIEDIVSFLGNDFSFVDGTIVGNGDSFIKRRLRPLHKYYSRREMLPLKVSNRTVNIIDDIGWIACELMYAPEQNNSYGWLTQIFMRQRNGNWILVRHHFSAK